MAKFDDEWKRRMVEVDKHSIKSYRSLNTVVKKLDLDMVAPQIDGSNQYCRSIFGKRQQWGIPVCTAYGDVVRRENFDMENCRVGSESLKGLE